MKEKRSFGPQSLRSILSVLLVVIVLAGAGAFYYGLGIVKAYAEEVNQKLAVAEASDTQAQGAQEISRSVAQKADMLFSTPSNFEEQARDDINAYARSAGVSIENIDTSETAPRQIAVRMSAPTSYDGLLTFLYNIETNLPKMQLVGLSIERPSDGNSDNVIVNEILINVLVR